MAHPSLQTSDIRKIEKILHQWECKLTWSLLVDIIESKLKITTTRQTLNSYSSIKAAYDTSKQLQRGKPSDDFVKFTKADKTAYERIQRLETTVESLNKKIDSQLALIQEINREASKCPLVAQTIHAVKARIQSKIKQ